MERLADKSYSNWLSHRAGGDERPVFKLGRSILERSGAIARGGGSGGAAELCFV